MKSLAGAFILCLGLALAWPPATPAADAQTLYARCAGCHGADGGKTALGVGKPLKGMSAQEVARYLQGYKAKAIGGPQKAVMEAQAALLSDQDIQALAALISQF
ncbi:MAG: c-type cytochrome [Desulfarculus sp.]|nr:c-type cytochrome [Desulfarculus sp.]